MDLEIFGRGGRLSLKGWRTGGARVCERDRARGMDEHGWCRSRIVWMTGKVGMVKCAWICVYAPVNEKGMKGKMKLEKFWEDLSQVIKKFKSVRRVFLLGDMNARVGNTEIGGVVGKYGVEGGRGRGAVTRSCGINVNSSLTQFLL